MYNREDIQEKVNLVIKSSQNLKITPNTDDLMNNWEENKKDFISWFGGEAIYEYPEVVDFELTEHEKDLIVDEFIRTIKLEGENDLVAFLQKERGGFFSNSVVEEYTYEDHTIPVGMKLVKAFKFFCSGGSMLEKLQIEASRIIQQNKIGGKLCLSVHPLDFLSSSENCSNWRSCHALDGEYRAGNLSYIGDNTTIMAYLKSADGDRTLPRFPFNVKWNNKKWRTLLFFSDDRSMIMAGRSYPYQAQKVLDFIINKILPNLMPTHNNWKGKTENFFTDWLNYRVSTTPHSVLRSPYIPIEDKLVPMNEIVSDDKNSMHYNDLLRSTCYFPSYCFVQEVVGSKEWLNKKRVICGRDRFPHFKVGKACKCVLCGDKEIDYPSTMLCTPCEKKYGDADSQDFLNCFICGERYPEEQGIWVEHPGEMICPDCFNDSARYCTCCDESFYIDDMIYSEKTDAFYCKRCWEDDY